MEIDFGHFYDPALSGEDIKHLFAKKKSVLKNEIKKCHLQKYPNVHRRLSFCESLCIYRSGS